MKTLSSFEQIAKKNKRKNWIKLILISMVVSLLAIFGIYISLSKLASRSGEKVQESYLLLSEIAYPNVDYNSWGYQTTSPFSGTFYSHRVKDIDGIMVPFEKYEGDYSIILSSSLNQGERLKQGDNGQSAYTFDSLYKAPLFYGKESSTTSKYKVTQDLNFIGDMTGQAVEVAITFDKAYTLAEIEQKVPSNLKLNWVWIGRDDNIDFDGDLAGVFGFTPFFDMGLNAEQQKALEKELDEANKKGPDAVSAVFERYNQKEKITPLEGMKNSYSNFQDRAKTYVSGDYGDTIVSGKDGKAYSKKDFLKDYLEKNQNPDTATFSGIILTGRAENFAQLKEADWIYASNIGQTVQIQPYHVLEK